MDEMNKDQGIGALILVGSIGGVAVYAWLIYAFTVVVLQITAFVAVAGILGIAAWIGWTMATTPPPASLEPMSTQTETATKKEEKPA